MAQITKHQSTLGQSRGCWDYVTKHLKRRYHKSTNPIFTVTLLILHVGQTRDATEMSRTTESKYYSTKRLIMRCIASTYIYIGKDDRFIESIQIHTRSFAYLASILIPGQDSTSPGGLCVCTPKAQRTGQTTDQITLLTTIIWNRQY